MRELKIIQNVIDREGGLVNDPDDKGGLTKYGITKRFFPWVDIENLTKGEAVDIYKEHYWDKYRVNKIPEDLQADYFDAMVNLGRRGAGRVVQEAINSTRGKKLKVDGIVGPNTMKEIHRINASRFKAYRILRYAKIVMSDKTQSKFYYGWFNRTMEVE